MGKFQVKPNSPGLSIEQPGATGASSSLGPVSALVPGKRVQPPVCSLEIIKRRFLQGVPSHLFFFFNIYIYI